MCLAQCLRCLGLQQVPSCSYHESTERLARLRLACARARCLAVSVLYLFRWTGKPTSPWLWVKVDLLSPALCPQHWGYLIRQNLPGGSSGGARLVFKLPIIKEVIANRPVCAIASFLCGDFHLQLTPCLRSHSLERRANLFQPGILFS